MKVEELTPNSRNVDVTVKVVEEKKRKDVTSRDGRPHTVAELLVADESGSVILSLWDDKIEVAEAGKVYDIKNAYVTVFRNSMRLSLGRRGTMEVSESKIEENTSKNLSDKHVENPRRFGRRRSGGRGRF